MRSVFAIFRDPVNAERAMEELKEADFRTSDISIFIASKESSGDDLIHVLTSKYPEGIAAGGAFGLLLGAFLSVYGNVQFLFDTNMVTDSLAKMGLSSMIFAMVGGLIGIFIPEYEVKRLAKKKEKSEVLI